MKGKVYLVGAGPGDPELLTVKALRILKCADVLLHDDLVSPEILALVPHTTFLYNVGKRCGNKSMSQEQINSLLVNLASSGLQVVRLKGGDPFIFGRGGEEVEALRRAGLEIEIVPGVTAVLGAAAMAQIPLTHRQVSSAVVFLTAHRTGEKASDDWGEFVSAHATLVVYMPGHDYEAIACKLRQAGISKQTACAIVSRATTPEQQVYRTSVQDLVCAPVLPAPTLLIVGEVVEMASEASLHQLEHGLIQQESFSLTARDLIRNPEEQSA